jgi:hypothetical protein
MMLEKYGITRERNMDGWGLHEAIEQDEAGQKNRMVVIIFWMLYNGLNKCHNVNGNAYGRKHNERA